MKIVKVEDINFDIVDFNSSYYNAVNKAPKTINIEPTQDESAEGDSDSDEPKLDGAINLNEIDDEFISTVFALSKDDENIVSINPLSLYCLDTDKKGVNAKIVLIFLAKTKSNKLLTLNTIYQIETEEEYNFLKNNVPFYNDKNNYAEEYSRQTIDSMIENTLPKFVTDLETVTDDVLNNNAHSFNIKGFYGTNYEKNEVVFTMTPAIFCCIKFTEAYIKESIVNNHDILLSGGHGFMNTDISLFVVDDVDSIVNIAPVNFKKSSEIMVVVRTMYYIDKGVKEFTNLLFTTDPGAKFSKSKFNSSPEDITKNYMEDADQYLTEFFFDTRVNDKAYTCYLALNKNNQYKLFMFDTKAQTDMTKMIIEFNNKK